MVNGQLPGEVAGLVPTVIVGEPLAGLGLKLSRSPRRGVVRCSMAWVAKPSDPRLRDSQQYCLGMGAHVISFSAHAPSRGGLLSARFEVMIRSTALAQKSFKEPRLLAVPPRPVLP